MDWVTQISKPFALIKSGNGCKLVFLTNRNKKGELVGHSFKAHWKKVMKGNFEVYDSKRIVEESQIIKSWSNWPTLNGVKKAVEIGNKK